LNYQLPIINYQHTGASRMRKLVLLCIVLVMTLLAPAAMAWNETGHMTVALIAYRRLSDSQKQKIAALLKQHPHYGDYLAKNVPPGVSEDEWAFMRAAVWPDWVRPSRPGDRSTFKDARITRYHQALWHYIDIPFVPRSAAGAVDPTTLPASTQPAENVLTALELNAQKLRNAGTPATDRAVALAWLEHLVGDVHQPLHATTLYNEEYPTGDKGGNSLAVRAEGNIMNLHAYWDEQLGISGDSYTAVEFLASDIIADPRCDPAHNPQYAKDTAFRSWADESHDYGVALTYLSGRLKTASYTAWQQHQIPDESIPPLPPGYAANARDLSRHRIALAGWRLADQIKALLGD
jgi:hypothetical protein